MSNQFLAKRIKRNIRTLRIFLFFHPNKVYGGSIILRQIIKDYFSLENLTSSDDFSLPIETNSIKGESDISIQDFINVFEEGDFTKLTKNKILSLADTFDVLMKKYSSKHFLSSKKIFYFVLSLLLLSTLFIYLFCCNNNHWRVVYYKNPDFKSPFVNTYYDSEVSIAKIFQDLGFSPFSARFSTCLKLPKNYEKVTFSLKSDDGSRLFIDNNLVLDNWGRHDVRNVSTEVSLSSGVHFLEIKYNNIIGKSELIFDINPKELSTMLFKPEYGFKCTDTE